MKAALGFYAMVVLAAVGLDQWVKRLIVSTMRLHETIELAPFLALYHTRNTGIAFSLFAGFDDGLMLAITIAVVAFVLWLAARSAPRQYLARTGFALIIGGALGNLIDRATLGYVVDYVLFHTANWSFAVFNLADACISMGAGLIILQELVDWRAAKSRGGPRAGG